MRLHRRNLVVWSSAVQPASCYVAPQRRRIARTARIRRAIRIGALLTVIAVRPRWRPLLAGALLTVVGVVLRSEPESMLLIPGLLLLWRALLITGNPDPVAKSRSQLERELAAHSTPAQRRDLAATLDRYPDGITAEMRNILGRRA
jgi:hypothetical protein